MIIAVDYASGGNSNRPQFQTMHDGARKKEFDLILVLALDRLNREGILNTLSYLKVLKQHNVALKSLQERLKLPTKEAFILLLNSYKITDAVEGNTQL